MTQASLPGGATVTFKYDPFGRRVQMVSAGGTTNYVYDGANAVEEVDSAGFVIAKYAQGPGIDQPLAMLRSGATSFYQADGLGSITSLTDNSAAVASSYTYETFGKLSASSGTLLNPFRYTARDYDSETGLHYYRTRYYDSYAGRFSAEDALQFSAGNNFYEYSYNSPTNFTDPSGRQPAPAYVPPPPPALTVIGGGGAAISGGGAAAGGAGAGVIAATVGLIALDAALLVYDIKQVHNLGLAYGWWGKNPNAYLYHSQASLNAAGTEKAQQACTNKAEDDDDLCWRMYEADLEICRILKSSSCYDQAMLKICRLQSWSSNSPLSIWETALDDTSAIGNGYCGADITIEHIC